MLHERYKDDGRALLALNSLQTVQRDAVRRKIALGEYKVESICCPLCGSDDSEKLSEKDRYGLRAPVCVCRGCGLLRTNPRMTAASYSQFYEKEYRKLYVGNPAPTERFFNGQYDHGVKIREFLENIRGGHGKRITGRFIVEIGTGAGGILKAFSDAGNDVLGLDLGSEYLEYGRRRGLDLRKGSIHEALANGRKADGVIYSHAFEHVLDPVEELRNVRNLLKNDGWLYIEVPGVRALDKSKHGDFLRTLQNAHTYYFTRSTLERLASMVGFEMVVGDESVRALFRTGIGRTMTESEYPSIVSYLRQKEAMPRGGRRGAFGGGLRTALLTGLRSLGILGLLKRLYYRIKYRS